MSLGVRKHTEIKLSMSVNNVGYWVHIIIYYYVQTKSAIYYVLVVLLYYITVITVYKFDVVNEFSDDDGIMVRSIFLNYKLK